MPLPAPRPLRPDVKAAVVAALEESLEESYPRGITADAVRQIIEVSVANRAAGCRRETLIRALEMVLDQVALAFPIPTASRAGGCPECHSMAVMGRRDAEGGFMEWCCAEGHKWYGDPIPDLVIED